MWLSSNNCNDEGIQKYYLKHRFIFECFHGKINNAKLVVDHINNIKTDNRLQNLQLITQSQNMKKEHRKGRKSATDSSSSCKYKFWVNHLIMIVLTNVVKS